METGIRRSTLLSRRGRRAALGAAAFFGLAFVAAAQPREIDRISLLGVKNPFLESAASEAVSLARRKLESPRCQQIFSDFSDPSGRLLQAKLDALGHTGASFLEILRFANGERLAPCQISRVLAATTPNSHVIFLCGLQFFERQHRDREFSAALVIHEMLHSLGLGENPPASDQITMRVRERCGP